MLYKTQIKQVSPNYIWYFFYLIKEIKNKQNITQTFTDFKTNVIDIILSRKYCNYPIISKQKGNFSTPFIT